MQSIIYSLKETLSINKFSLLTVLANVFFGYALGKTIVTPGSELGESIAIRLFLIVGTCLLSNYLLCLRKSLKGVNRTPKGRLRPHLREAALCAFLNVFMFLSSLTLFLIKSQVA